MDGGRTIMKKISGKWKWIDVRHLIPWLCWEQLFLMLCMLWMDKGSYLNLDLMIFGNYVVIMFILMFIYIHVYMYVSMHVIFWWDHDCFMLIFICIYHHKSFLWRNDSLCGWLTWSDSWFMRNKVGRVAL